MFQSILCVIDFTTATERAVEHATEWAQQQKCALELLHVVDPPVYMAPPELPELYLTIETSMMTDAEERMAAQIVAVRRRVPTASGRVIGGLPARTILEHITALGADLVVVGTHPRTALSRAFLGSVADRVLRTSPVPVLLVPQDGRAVEIVPKLIVTPTDFSAPARDALTFCLALAREVGAFVEVVHAFEVPPKLDPNLTRALRVAVSSQLAAEHPELAGRPDVRVQAREGAPAETIFTLTEEAGADLVLMASTGRGLLSGLLLGGVTDRVARTSVAPVLVMRPRAS